MCGNAHSRRPRPGKVASHFEGKLMSKTDNAPPAPATIPQTKPTGQRRSLARGKATRKKNPGKRAKQG